MEDKQRQIQKSQKKLDELTQKLQIELNYAHLDNPKLQNKNSKEFINYHKNDKTECLEEILDLQRRKNNFELNLYKNKIREQNQEIVQLNTQLKKLKKSNQKKQLFQLISFERIQKFYNNLMKETILFYNIQKLENMASLNAEEQSLLNALKYQYKILIKEKKNIKSEFNKKLTIEQQKQCNSQYFESILSEIKCQRYQLKNKLCHTQKLFFNQNFQNVSQENQINTNLYFNIKQELKQNKYHEALNQISYYVYQSKENILSKDVIILKKRISQLLFLFPKYQQQYEDIKNNLKVSKLKEIKSLRNFLKTIKNDKDLKNEYQSSLQYKKTLNQNQKNKIEQLLDQCGQIQIKVQQKCKKQQSLQKKMFLTKSDNIINIQLNVSKSFYIKKISNINFIDQNLIKANIYKYTQIKLQFTNFLSTYSQNWHENIQKTINDFCCIYQNRKEISQSLSDQNIQNNSTLNQQPIFIVCCFIIVYKLLNFSLNKSICIYDFLLNQIQNQNFVKYFSQNELTNLKKTNQYQKVCDIFVRKSRNLITINKIKNNIFIITGIIQHSEGLFQKSQSILQKVEQISSQFNISLNCLEEEEKQVKIIQNKEINQKQIYVSEQQLLRLQSISCQKLKQIQDIFIKYKKIEPKYIKKELQLNCFKQKNKSVREKGKYGSFISTNLSMRSMKHKSVANTFQQNIKNSKERSQFFRKNTSKNIKNKIKGTKLDKNIFCKLKKEEIIENMEQIIRKNKQKVKIGFCNTTKHVNNSYKQSGYLCQQKKYLLKFKQPKSQSFYKHIDQKSKIQIPPISIQWGKQQKNLNKQQKIIQQLKTLDQCLNYQNKQKYIDKIFQKNLQIQSVRNCSKKFFQLILNNEKKS